MTTTFSEPFLRLTREHAAWGAEQLETFNEFLPMGEWSADLGQCLYRQSGRELRISLLGTFDTDEQSWLWAWANPGFQGSPVARAAESLRAYGRTHGLPEFTSELLRLAAHEEPRRAAETLAFTAMGVLGASGYIGVQANPSARAYLLPDDPRSPSPNRTRSRSPVSCSPARDCSAAPPGRSSRATSPTTTCRCAGRPTA
ncbi:DUF6882 domain-containing protein [Streptomyces sp. 5K101]|uniref:DUF6882 domain-containing protein n=1 Tax=Streptomyces sp. 5K101 TaxID=3390037 RepID=UPI0039758E1C